MAAAWLAGLGLQLQQATLATSSTHAGLVGGGVVALLGVVWQAAGKQARPARWSGGVGALGAQRLARGLLLASALAGAGALAYGLTVLRAELRLAERLAPALEGQDLLVTGVVATVPQSGPAGTRFVFEVERAERVDRVARAERAERAEHAAGRGQPVQLPSRLTLGWYSNFQDEAFLDDPQAELRRSI